MQVSVITPYVREDPALLEQAHRSVMEQSLPCTHVFVSDGTPNLAIDGWDAEHIRLPHAHADGGDLARGIGALHAISAGAEAVAFLDADNWYEPDHIESLVALCRSSGRPICTSARCIRRLDGTVLDAVDDESDGVAFADVNTLLIHRDAVDALALWATIPPEVGPICDRVFWALAQRRGYVGAHTGRPTVNYRTRWYGHYVTKGETPPPGMKDGTANREAILFWNDYVAKKPADWRG